MLNEELTNEGEISSCGSGSLPRHIEDEYWAVRSDQVKWAWSSYMYKNLDCRWVETLRYWAMRKGDRLNWTQTSMICCNSFLFIWEKLAMASVTIVILKGKLLNEEILTWGHYTGSDNRLWVWGSYYTEAFSIAGSVLTSEGGDVIVRWGLVREAERSSLLIQDL